MSRDYIAEKLWTAVDMLDNGRNEDIRERLIYAATGSLIRLELDDFEDPGDRAEFERVMTRLRSFAAPDDQGDISASARLLTTAEAEELAASIRTLQRRYPME